MAAIALLHAFPLGPEMFAAQQQALTSAGHEVMVPSLLHPSQPYPDRPDLAAMADEVFRVMNGLGHRRFAVAGLSMGGYVAMAMLRADSAAIDGLALLDTRASPDTEVAAQGRLDYAERVLGEGMGWVPGATISGLLGETTRNSRPAVVQRVTDWILAADPVAVAWAQRAMAARPDSRAQLMLFRRPALVLLGQEDTLTPLPESLDMAQALGGAPMTEIAGAGHLSCVETPNRVSEQLLSWAGRL